MERRGGGVCGKGVKEPFAPTLPAVYIENFKYPEYPASGPEYPDSPEFPGPGSETPGIGPEIPDKESRWI